MMKKYKCLLNFLTILLLILFTSCTKESKKNISLKSIDARGKGKTINLNTENVKLLNINNNNAEKIIIPSDVLDSPMINVSKLVSNIKFISLETTSESIVGKVHNLLHDSNFYFIHDKKNNKLLRFSDNGKFLNSIGDLGKGPQELISIWDVAINKEKKEISILDSKSRKINRYKYSGEFIDSQPLYYMISQHEYGNNKLIFSVSKVQQNIRIPAITSYSLLLADNDFVPLGLAFKNPEKPNSFMTEKPLRKHNNNIFYHHPYSDGIWEIQDSTLIPTIKFIYEDNGIPLNVWENNIDNKEFRKLLDSYLHFSGDYVITDKYCYFSVFGEETISYLFFNRVSKSVIYGSGFKFNQEIPLTILFNTPIGCKKDGSFMSIVESFELKGIKNYVNENEDIKNLFKNNSNWELVKKIKQTDNPIIVTYQLKNF